MAPITDLTGKKCKNVVEWTSVHESAFVKLKDWLSQPPILRLPDFEKQFILQTDASNTGIGAALVQEHNGKKYPVSCASKKLLPRERNFTATYMAGISFWKLTIDH
jgi:hypothetical protein